MTDTVSIIIPVYNSEKTLHRCVQSVLNQSYTNIEIILINDGSTDSSADICKQFQSNDNRIKYVDKKNGGVSSARNSGIDISTGDYIMFLDSDDWYETDIVERYVFFIKESDVVIGQLSVVSVDDNSYYVKKLPCTGKFGKELWSKICESTEMFGYIGGKMFKSNIIKEYSIRFNEKMYAQEDLDFCLSYYNKINTFCLTDYSGYCYYFQQGKRKPPYIDFINNQLKLFRYATSVCDITVSAKENIQQRISGYIYMMFYDSHTIEQFSDVCSQLKNVRLLDEYLVSCRFSGKMKYIIFWYISGKYTLIYRYFKLRNFIKRILRRK